MRVLAVRQLAHLLVRVREALRERLTAREPVGDRRLVRSGGREGLGGEPAARRRRHRSRVAELGEHLVVLVRARHGRDVGEVLRGRAEHRRAPDVDHLDGLLLARAVAARDVLERIQVHADQVERRDVLFVERGHVAFLVAAGEDRGVDARVERLHAAAEHLGHLRELLDARHLEAGVLERRRGSAARDELDAETREPAREVLEPVLAVDGEQRAHQPISSRTTSGSRRCSTACTRARSESDVSPGSTGTGSARITLPVSTPSST